VTRPDAECGTAVNPVVRRPAGIGEPAPPAGSAKAQPLAGEPAEGCAGGEGFSERWTAGTESHRVYLNKSNRFRFPDFSPAFYAAGEPAGRDIGHLQNISFDLTAQNSGASPFRRAVDVLCLGVELSPLNQFGDALPVHAQLCPDFLISEQVFSHSHSPCG
jgi:hypothetical protein